jgi:hypothetical protein
VPWSYSGDPKASPKDAVRFLISDTDSGTQLISDEEIEYLLEEESNQYLAAARAAEVIGASFTLEVQASAEGMSFSGDALMQRYFELADRLRQLAKKKTRLAPPYVGGISWAERERADADPDKIPTHFRSHMHDNPGAGRRADDPLAPRQW